MLGIDGADDDVGDFRKPLSNHFHRIRRNFMALLKPNPPRASGRVAATLAECEIAPGSAVSNVQKHLQT